MQIPPACPNCNSEDIGHSLVLRRKLQAFTLFPVFPFVALVFVLFPFLPRYECGECGYRWNSSARR